jgi:hypothetical protein
MLKLADNPELLYPAVDDLAAITGQWWVAHTKARFEKAFAADLANKNIPYFLPMVEKITFSGGRKRRGMMPLFAGYVFFAGSEQQRYEALLTDRLCQVIPARDQRQLIDELSALHRVIAGGLAIDLYPFAVVGQRVRVTDGPLMGVEGTIIHREHAAPRLVLSISMLGQGASMEIDVAALEPIE